MLAIALLLAAAQANPATAQAPCAAPGLLPPELAGWATPRALVAATAAGELDTATLSVGNAIEATLAPTPHVAYPVQPGHAGAATTHGGLFAFTATEAGSYRVALGAAAWIDLVAEGKSVTSTAHAHGPECTVVRKLVDFPLKPGRYILQVSDAADPALTLMIARLPG